MDGDGERPVSGVSDEPSMRRHTFAILGILAIVSPWPPRVFVYVPAFEFNWMRVEVGETRPVRVTARGASIAVFTPWTFTSTRPGVAAVVGKMDTPAPSSVAVTGILPGTAGILVRPYSELEQVAIVVECGREDPIQAETPERTVDRGHAVTLRVLTPIAHRMAFAWYRGRAGDTSQPLSASGPQVELVPDTSGAHYAWVLGTTPCSSSMAEFRIDVRAPKQRVVRR